MVQIVQNPRHKTHPVKVRDVTLGGGAPIVVQSMTNTDTADVEKTFEQVKELFHAGSEIVRVTVDRDDAAKGVIALREKLDAAGLNVPLAGCFHYNGHTLLNNFPELCEALDKYRINPGNVGFGAKKDPLGVNIHHPVPFFIRRIHDLALLTNTRIADEYIDMPKGFI